MNLHRTTGRPDWDDVAPSERNAFQRLAAATHSYGTPGNIITLLGFGLVVLALISISQHHYWLSVALLVAGRLLDIADGWAAEATGTKSPLGESLDAGFDKLSVLATIIVLFTSHTAIWWVLLALVIPHVFITIFSAIRIWQDTLPHPSRIGKLGMAAAWVSLPGLVILKAAPHLVTAVVVYGLVIVSCGLSLIAAYGYVRTEE